MILLKCAPAHLMISVQANDALSWQAEVGRFCGTGGSGCDTEVTSVLSEGREGDLGGMSGGDSQGQSDQVTLPMVCSSL